MPIRHLTQRLEKGARLTPAEGDADWQDIEDFVNAIEERLNLAVNDDGTLVDQRVQYATSASGSDAYAIAIGGTFATLADLAGHIFVLKVDVVNTGPATLAVNGLAATAIKNLGGIDLSSGDLKIGINAVAYDPANAAFVLIGRAGNSKVNYGTTTNAGNDYTLTIANLTSSPFEVPPAYYAGYRVSVKINATNAGDARLKIAVTSPAIDLGFVNIKKLGTSALVAGDLLIDQIYDFVYDGTFWQVVTNPGTQNFKRFSQSDIVIPTAAGPLASAPVHGLGGVPDIWTFKLKCIGNASGVAHGYAIGDRPDISIYIGLADLQPRLKPFADASKLDLICEYGSGAGTMQIWIKTPTGSATSDAITMSTANFVLDFKLEVTAIRF